MERISIIIPTCNESDTIEESIESVLYLQKNVDFEIIVIDASTDNTPYIIKEYAKKHSNIKLIRAEQKNTAVQRNQGIKASTGSLIMNMSGHAILTDGTLEVLKELLDKQPPSVAGVGCCLMTPNSNNFSEQLIGNLFNTRMGGMGSTDQYRHTSDEGEIVDSIAFVLYKKSILEQFMFDPELPVGQDAELHYRMKKAGFKLVLTSNTHILHHKRTSLKKFWNQMERCGYYRARIIKKHPRSTRLVFFFPSLFLVVGTLLFLNLILTRNLFSLLLFIIPSVLYYLIGFTSMLFESDFDVAMSLVSPLYYFAIHGGYGWGFIKYFGGLKND